MAYTGTAKSIGSIMNRLDRAAKRADRERERLEKNALHRRQIRTPERAAADYEAELERLTRRHRIAWRRTDWQAKVAQGRVQPAGRTRENELAARYALANYHPGFFERLFGLERDKRRQLTAAVGEAVKADDAHYQAAKKAAAEHNAEVDLGAKLLDLDFRAIEQAMSSHTRLAELEDLTDGVSLVSPAKGRLVAFIEGLDLEDMPDEGFTAVGDKLTAGPLSLAKRNEIHLAYACSLSLRVGAELLAILPVERLEVVFECGTPDAVPALYLPLKAETLARLEWDKLDAVRAASEMGVRLNWTPGNGLAPIAIDDLQLGAEPAAEAV